MDNPESGSNEALSVSQGSQALESFFDADYADEPAAPVEKAPEAAEPEQAPEPEPVEKTEPEASTETEPAQDAETFTVKIDGKEVKVTKDELLAGYQRQSDYTRKTMEAAEQRKAAEAETSAARQQREQYAQNLQRNQAVLEASLQEQQNIDWAGLIDSDPVEYLKQRDLLEKRQQALQLTYQQQNELRSQAQAEHERSFRQHISAQREQLLAKVPEWKDEAKLKAGTAEIKAYLLESGYSENEISSVHDHRAVLNVRKAMLYDKMIADARVAAKKVAATPQKVERPGVADQVSVDKRGAAFQRLNKSGSVRDAASVFESLL